MISKAIPRQSENSVFVLSRDVPSSINVVILTPILRYELFPDETIQSVTTRRHVIKSAQISMIKMRGPNRPDAMLKENLRQAINLNAPCFRFLRVDRRR